MHGAWTRGLYFHFRSKIWRHRRVPRPRLLLWRTNFGDSAINERYIAYFFIAHARNGRISTSGLKSDVTIAFLDPDFLYSARISAIRIHLRQIYFYLIFAWVFRTSCPKMGVLGDKIGEGVVRYWPPNELVLTFWGSYVCANFGENRSRNATVRVPTDGQTHTHTDRQTQTDFIICPMLYTIAMGQIIRPKASSK